MASINSDDESSTHSTLSDLDNVTGIYNYFKHEGRKFQISKLFLTIFKLFVKPKEERKIIYRFRLHLLKILFGPP